MYVYVDTAACTGCAECVSSCPYGAIVVEEGRARIHSLLCDGCEACLGACPEDAIVALEVLPEGPPEPGVSGSSRPSSSVQERETKGPVVANKPTSSPTVEHALALGTRLAETMGHVLLDVLAARSAGHERGRDPLCQGEGRRAGGRRRLRRGPRTRQ